MNNINIDKERKDRSDSWNQFYSYHFQTMVCELEKRGNKEIDIMGRSLRPTVFESLVADFVINLRENMYGEEYEDLITTKLDRLIHAAPLKEEEKISELLKKEEIRTLKQLKQKYPDE